MSKVPTMQAWISCNLAHAGTMRPMDRIEINLPVAERDFIIDIVGESFQAHVVPKGVLLKRRREINQRGLYSLGIRQVQPRKDGSKIADRLRFTITGTQDPNVAHTPAFGLAGVVALVDLVNKTIFIPFVVEELRRRVKRHTYRPKAELPTFATPEPAQALMPLNNPLQTDIKAAVFMLNESIAACERAGITVTITQLVPGMPVELAGTQTLTF